MHWSYYNRILLLLLLVLLLGISSQNIISDVVFLVALLLILTLPILTFLALLTILLLSFLTVLSWWFRNSFKRFPGSLCPLILCSLCESSTLSPVKRVECLVWFSSAKTKSAINTESPFKTKQNKTKQNKTKQNKTKHYIGGKLFLWHQVFSRKSLGLRVLQSSCSIIKVVFHGFG